MLEYAPLFNGAVFGSDRAPKRRSDPRERRGLRRKLFLVVAVAVFGCGLLVFGTGELLIRRATGPPLSGVRPAEGVEEVHFTAKDAVALR